MIILETILVIIICLMSIIGLHFICIPISSHFRKKKIFQNNKFMSGKHVDMYLTSSKDLMFHIDHFTKDWADDYENDFARQIVITFGGISIFIKFGHSYLHIKDPLQDESKTLYFGLYSIDGDLFWDNFWFGSHLYPNPFKPNHFIKSTVFDMSSLNMISYHSDDHPYVRRLKDVPYTDKTNNTSNVRRLDFYIVRRHYTLPLLHFLHMSKLYTKSYTDLEFDSSGLGVDKGWKGQVCGSSIRLDDPNEHELLYLLNRTIGGNYGYLPNFNIKLDERISQFLTADKKY